MFAGELYRLLSLVPSSSSVLVFVHRAGALEPEVLEITSADVVATEDVIVLHVDSTVI